MKRIISSLLVLLMLLSCFTMSGCTKLNKTNKEEKKEEKEEAMVLKDEDALETFMIADFESYEEIIRMKSKNSLGTLTENRDRTFMKSGHQSLKLKVHGRENLNYIMNQEPMLEIYTTVESIGKVDYSN